MRWHWAEAGTGMLGLEALDGVTKVFFRRSTPYFILAVARLHRNLEEMTVIRETQGGFWMNETESNESLNGRTLRGRFLLK